MNASSVRPSGRTVPVEEVERVIAGLEAVLVAAQRAERTADGAVAYAHALGVLLGGAEKAVSDLRHLRAIARGGRF